MNCPHCGKIVTEKTEYVAKPRQSPIKNLKNSGAKNADQAPQPQAEDAEPKKKKA